MSRIVTLLTDYGTQDSYVAEMKGRILGIAARVTLVDVTHDIEPGDIQAGAFVLGRAWPLFPEGTVHVAVVDPGVGTSRRALVVAAAKHVFVGPDNGLLEPALALPGARAEAIAVRSSASATFHGRDVFATAAAAIAAEEHGAFSFGNAVHDPVRLTIPAARIEGAAAVGTVVHIDRFGTLVTNIDGKMLEGRGTVHAAGQAIPVHATFGDVARGQLVAFVGSGGTLEIAVNGGRADELLQMKRGAKISAAQ